MFYFLFENKADSKNELSLINQITRDLGCEKNKIHAVNFPQSSSSHYDFYKVCENTFNFDRDNHPSNFFVLCADVDDRDLLIMLLKHNDKIKLKLKVDNKDFLNEHQVYLIYKLGRYSAHSSYRRTTREKEIVNLRENLLSSLITNW